VSAGSTEQCQCHTATHRAGLKHAVDTRWDLVSVFSVLTLLLIFCCHCRINWSLPKLLNVISLGLIASCIPDSGCRPYAVKTSMVMPHFLVFLPICLTVSSLCWMLLLGQSPVFVAWLTLGSIASFHWLHAPELIKFKLAVIVYQILRGTAPRYLSDTMNCVADISSEESSLLIDLQSNCGLPATSCHHRGAFVHLNWFETRE